LYADGKRRAIDVVAGSTIKQRSATIVIFEHLIQTASSLPTDASALESAISALESAITALDSSSGLWETLAWVFTGAVVIGVAIEVRVIVLEHRDAMTEWRRGIVRPPDRPSRSLFLWGLVGSILVALGVAGELGVGIKVTLINGALRTKNAELRRKSDQLIALLHVEAQEAQKTAGEANERAEGMKEALAPRRLTEQQELAIGKSLRSFKGQLAQMVYDGNSSEAQTFAIDIWKALKHAKWRVFFPATVWSGVRVGNDVPLGDVGTKFEYEGIEVLHAATSRTAALALAAELQKLGFNAVARIPPDARKDSDGIQVSVEIRPVGPQGSAKLLWDAKKRQATSTQTAKP